MPKVVRGTHPTKRAQLNGIEALAGSRVAGLEALAGRIHSSPLPAKVSSPRDTPAKASLPLS